MQVRLHNPTSPTMAKLDAATKTKIFKELTGKDAEKKEVNWDTKKSATPGPAGSGT
ncbi:MAG: hypothetical protein U0744_04795 [Gemmataceae bacterium]